MSIGYDADPPLRASAGPPTREKSLAGPPARRADLEPERRRDEASLDSLSLLVRAFGHRPKTLIEHQGPNADMKSALEMKSYCVALDELQATGV